VGEKVPQEEVGLLRVKEKGAFPCPQRGRKTPLGFFKTGPPNPSNRGVTVKFVVNFLVVLQDMIAKGWL